MNYFTVRLHTFDLGTIETIADLRLVKMKYTLSVHIIRNTSIV